MAPVDSGSRLSSQSDVDRSHVLDREGRDDTPTPSTYAGLPGIVLAVVAELVSLLPVPRARVL